MTLNAWTAEPVTPRYRYVQDSIMYMETNTIYRRSINGRQLDEGQARDISYITTVKSGGTTARQTIDTYYMQRPVGVSDSTYKLVHFNKQKVSRDRLGTTSGAINRIGITGILQFPEGKVQPGEDWTLPITWNVSFFTVKKRSAAVNMTMHYRFTGLEEMEGQTIMLISANAVFAEEGNGTLYRDARLFKLTGFCSYLFRFNLDDGKIETIDETFDILYILHDGTIVEMSGSSYSWTKIPPPPVRDSFITEKITRDRTIRVRKRKDSSLAITLQKIQFRPDSAILMQEEKSRLDSVAETLSNYRFNHIIIIGHTADIGRPEAQLTLSEERARIVAGYLVSRHKFNPDLVSYQGKGATEPVADNTSDEGRAQNRRVEIIILPR
jgi:outer membrane protein OmpA-like peptidoglycan-associated protein